MGSVPNETYSTVNSKTKFRVAIIGGGIGGLTAAIGLMKYPQIDVQIYESAAAFGEIGAGITIGPNAAKALELIGPDTRAAFDKHKTPNLWSTRAHNYTENRCAFGEQDGEVIASQTNETGMQCVHRARFLEELIRCIPAYRAHFNKRLYKIDEPNESDEITLYFKDGTIATTDAVIGYDGIHSAVRASLLGADHPATEPQFTGTASYRALVPMGDAIERIGAELAQNSTMLCGPGKAIMSYPIDHGETLNVVLMDYEQSEWPWDKWVVPATYDDLAKKLQGWGPAAQGMIELMDSPDLKAWAMFDAPPAPFYSKGRVCMAGDAAHASTPYQGQGAAQAIEDALVLEHLFGHVTKISQISHALAAYDQTRRPRTQRVVTTSRESGQLLGMKAEGVGSDLKKMKEKLDYRMHWIWNRNLTAQNEAALRLFRESL